MSIFMALVLSIQPTAHLTPDALPNRAQAPEPEPQSVIADVSGVLYSGSCVIPCYIIECESGGNYLAENDYSTASGKYQIVDGTWAGYGGYSHAADAPPTVQDAKARELWAGGAGASHWESCL